MGVLQRFERRLEGLVEGTFAKVFKGDVQPVEVAQALQRECDDKRAIVSEGRVLVPNEFIVELSGADHARLAQYAEPLTREFAAMVSEHAAENAYSLLGPVVVTLEEAKDLDTGVFRVRSGVAAGPGAREAVGRSRGSGARNAESVSLPPDGSMPGAPRLVLGGTEKHDRHSPEGMGSERAYYLTKPVTTIGRGADVDIRLADGLVSRRHAEVRVEDGTCVVVDLGSTNGTLVNDIPVTRRQLIPSDRVKLGDTVLIFDQDPVS